MASQWRPHAKALQFILPPPPMLMRSTSSLSKQDLKDARIRNWAGLILRAGDYTEYCRLFLTPSSIPIAAPVWPRAPTFVSFHSADGEEERLALTPLLDPALHITDWSSAGIFMFLLLHSSFRRCIPCSNACNAPTGACRRSARVAACFSECGGFSSKAAQSNPRGMVFPYIPSFCILS